MPLVRGFVHLSAFLAVAAVAVAFGRWLREPSGAAALALLLVVAIIAVCLRRLYGPRGPAALNRRVERPVAETVARAAPTEERESLWATPLAEEEASPRVDLNLATAQELTALPGVGRVTAQRIIAERTAGGPFRSVGDLTRVGGFGPAKVRSLADFVKI